MKGLDIAYIPSNIAAFDDDAIAQGYTLIYRYLGAGTKSINKTELDTHRSKGLDVGLFWQNGPAATVLANARQTGISWATEALVALRTLGLPSTQSVVFALDPKLSVDHEALKDTAKVFEFVAGLTSVLGYKPWIYSERAPLVALLDAGLISGCVQCYAYSGNIYDSRANLVQNKGNVSGRVYNATVDILTIQNTSNYGKIIGGNMVKIGVAGSNQHRNPYAGLTNVQEDDFGKRAGDAAVAEARENGYEAQHFWIGGTGTESVDELIKMLDQMMAWKPTHALSIHSDVGSASVPEHVYPLINSSADATWATNIGKDVAVRMSWGFQKPSVRTDLTWCTHTKVLGPGKAVLLEMGDHNVVAHAKFNWDNAEFIGRMAMRGFMKGVGLAFKDGPVPVGVNVPPGTAYDRYRPGGVPIPPVKTLPLLQVTDAQRKGTAPYTKDLTDTNDIYTSPVFWLQKKINAHYPKATVYQAKDGSQRTLPMPVDGKFGPGTEGGLILFQSEHYGIDGNHLVPSGTTDPQTWGKLQSV